MARSFLSIYNLSEKEIKTILKRTQELKKEKEITHNQHILAGKSIAMIFEKLSTRTRVSFEVAINDLGANSIYLNPRDMQLGRGETIADTAKVLSSYLDGIIIRTYEQTRIEEFSKHSQAPVINALTDLEHPTQIVSDLFTIYESGIDINNFTIAFLGDGNNVANSFIGASAILGFKLIVACPVRHEPNQKIVEKAEAISPGLLKITHEPEEAVTDADVVYTDVWVSMGKENKQDTALKFKDFQVNKNLLSKAYKNPVIMHCLPAHRGEEITDEIMNSEKSIVFEQAENKLHSAKGILEFFLKN